MSGALTPKQQRFVAEYLKDLNATQAAIRAGYSKHTANEQGSQLLAKLSVRAAVDAAIAKRAGKLEITAEKVLRDIEAARAEAMAGGQFSAAIRAAELHGKHIGMFVDRSEQIIEDKRSVVRAPAPSDDATSWRADFAPAAKPH